MRAHAISSSPSTARGGGIRRGLAAASAALLLAAGLTVVSDTVAPVSASAAQDPTSCQGAVALTNGGFEQPRITAGSNAMLTEAQVPGWSTNDSRKQIEI